MQDENRRRLTTSERLCWIGGILFGLGIWAFLAQPGLNGTFALATGVVSAVGIGWILTRVFRARQNASVPMADAEILQVAKEINPVLPSMDDMSVDQHEAAEAEFIAADVVDVTAQPADSDEQADSDEIGLRDSSEQDGVETRPLFGGGDAHEDQVDENQPDAFVEDDLIADVPEAIVVAEDRPEIAELADAEHADDELNEVLDSVPVDEDVVSVVADGTDANAETPEFAPGGMSEPRLSGPDDLTLIDGVDKRMLRRLTNAGIYHFDQMAAWSAKDVVAATTAMGIGHKNRLKKQRWVEQAQDLTAGKLPDDTSMADVVSETVHDDNDGQRAE